MQDTAYGAWGDVAGWWYDWSKGRRFHVRERGGGERDCFIAQVIDLGGDALLGLCALDGGGEPPGRPEPLVFKLLSRVDLSWRGDGPEEGGERREAGDAERMGVWE